MELPLKGMWDDPAGYYSVFFPTEWEGDYSFRIYGTINGTEIDETAPSHMISHVGLERIIL